MSAATGSVIQDLQADQQTGQTTDDFVGDATYAGFQQKAGTVSGTDSILFRARFDTFTAADKWGNGGNFGIGMDLNGDGAIDLITMYSEGSGAVAGRSRTITFGQPGAGANNSPSTTTWTFPTQTAINLAVNTTYDYVAATDFAGFNGTQDAWLTFALTFADLQNAIRTYATGFSTYTVTYSSLISFIGFTSQQTNALNQDLYGAGVGGTTSATTFAALGALTAPINAYGSVPEPATCAQVGLLLLAAGVVAYRQRKPATAGRS
ncbi:MAG: hypothetical protein HYX71_10605 [Opitutae bacterium]|nr:hypothetical protein [Opitutae bacterium]